MTVFMSKFRKHCLVIDGGSTKPVSDGHGGYDLHTFQDIVARFNNYELDTETFFKNHEKELLDRGWTLEKINEKIRKSPQYGLHYQEIKPITKEDKIKAAMALKARAEEILKGVDTLEAKEGDSMDKVIEGTPEAMESEKEVKVYTEKCPDCDWVAESFVSESQMRNKLRGHRAGKHRK